MQRIGATEGLTKSVIVVRAFFFSLEMKDFQWLE